MLINHFFSTFTKSLARNLRDQIEILIPNSWPIQILALLSQKLLRVNDMNSFSLPDQLLRHLLITSEEATISREESQGSMG